MDNTTVVLRVLHPPFLRRFNQHLALVSSGSFGANSGFFVDVDGHLKPTRTSTFKADPDDPSKLSICQGISLVPTDHASNLWQLHFPDEYYNHVAALDAVRALNDPNLVPTSEDEAELADSVNNRFADNETYKKTIKKLKAKHPSIYPARLMNLPTVVELHKSFNTHKEYVKANDVGQILVVYGNVRHMNELEEGKFKPLKQFPGYWRDGVLSSSDVMKDIVGERYAKRAHDRRDFIPSIDECRRVEVRERSDVQFLIGLPTFSKQSISKVAYRLSLIAILLGRNDRHCQGCNQRHGRQEGKSGR